MPKTNQTTVTSSNPISAFLYMLKAVFVSYAVSFVLIFLTALLAVMQSLSDTSISILVNIVTAVGAALAGFMAGRHFHSKGIFFGAGCGIIYTILLCISGNIISASLNFGVSFLTALLIGILCGAVGGISGINTKRTRRR